MAHMLYLSCVVALFFFFFVPFARVTSCNAIRAELKETGERKETFKQVVFFVVVVFLVQFVFIYVIAPMKQTGRFFYTLGVSIS